MKKDRPHATAVLARRERHDKCRENSTAQRDEWSRANKKMLAEIKITIPSSRRFLPLPLLRRPSRRPLPRRPLLLRLARPRRRLLPSHHRDRRLRLALLLRHHLP